jgi:hypothetical protein
MHPALKQWQHINPPKYKKDWPGSMIRVHGPTQNEYPLHTYGRVVVPDRVLPGEAVLKLHSRYPNTAYDGKKTETLYCDWQCPACGHDHRREYTGEDLEGGRIEFVEEVPPTAGLKPVVSYLATPYSHPDPKIRQDRWLAVSRAAAYLIGSGLIVLSPISMGHPINVRGASLGLSADFAAWRETNMSMLRASNLLIILTLDGWRESVGVAAETDAARELGIPISHLCPVEDGYVSCLPWQSDLPPDHKHSPQSAWATLPQMRGIVYGQIPQDERGNA